MRMMKAAACGLVIVAVNGGIALAQDSSSAAKEAESYPEACRHQGAEAPMAPSASGNPADMKEHQRAAMEGMTEMHRNMMQGMMAEDPDVSFVCGMIAHHQGAIHMAKTELEHGDNDRAKEMAQKIIDAQTREIAEMKTWLEENL
jgi:uncharacterized protein (DUF305 family)